MKRPKLISLICIIGYLSVVLTFPQVFSPQIKKLGALVPALYGMLVAASFIAYVGVWYVKRWGVELYLLVFFLKILFNIAINDMGPGFYAGTILSLAFCIVFIRFYPRMDSNL